LEEGPRIGGAERMALWSALRRLLRSSVLLIVVLIAGYALAPAIELLPEAAVPIFGLQPSTISFLIIGALFVSSSVGFIRAAFHFLQLHPSLVLRFVPGLTSENPRAAARLFLNAAMLAIILVAYWIFSPALYLIPRIGGQMAAVMRLVIAAVVALSFWGIGSAIHRGLDRRLGMSIEEHRGMGGLVLLRRRAHKTLTYLVTTASILVVAYALFPAISIGAHIPIPGTGLSIGTVYWIVALSAMVPSVLSLMRNLLGLFGLGPEVLSKAFPAMSVRQASWMRRVSLNLIIVIAILMCFSIVSPYVLLIPSIGGYLGATGQVVVGAIAILFFWDVGRSLYFELENAFGSLEEGRL